MGLRCGGGMCEVASDDRLELHRVALERLGSVGSGVRNRLRIEVAVDHHAGDVPRREVVEQDEVGGRTRGDPSERQPIRVGGVDRRELDGGDRIDAQLDDPSNGCIDPGVVLEVVDVEVVRTQREPPRIDLLDERKQRIEVRAR